MQGNQIIIKIVIGGDCFRIGRFPASFADLEDIVHQKYESRLPENFCFKYEDCDNDSINIESQSDYEACYEYCLQEQLKSIKFRVDSKSYKQYYHYNHQQPNSLTATIGSQQFAPQQTQSAQINGALGVLVNPYVTSYQNITAQPKIANKMSPRSSSNNNNMFTSSNNVFASCIGQQQFQPGTIESSQNQFLQMMMLLQSQGAFSNQFGNSLRMNSGIIGGGGISGGAGNIITTNTSNNNNAGNNSGTNTNAVNQSHSSQAPIQLSKHTSEAHTSNDNPNSTFNNAKIQNSANQSQVEQLPLLGFTSQTSQQQTLQGNISFTNGKANLNAGSENSGQNNINFTFKASNKNAAWVPQDLNSTSKFFNQESQISKQDNQFMNNQGAEMINIINPMESDEVLSPLIGKRAVTSIKRTNSINPDQEQEQNNTSGSQIPFFLKAIKTGAGNNSGSSIVSQTVDIRQVSTAQQSNYSQNTLGISGNVGNFGTAQTSQYSNQVTQSRDLSNVVIPQPAKGAQGSSNHVCSEDVEDNKKREYSTSPPLFKLDSSNTLTQNKVEYNRPFSLSTTAQRSGSNVQIPCEKCIIRSEELKLKEPLQNELKTPTNNALNKEVPPFIPQSDCKACQGTGFLTIEDNRVLNIIQSVTRQKLKESEILLKSVSVRQQKIGKIIPKEIMSCLQRMLNLEEVNSTANVGNTLSEPTEQKAIISFICSQKCWECKKKFENENYVYLCIDCKSQAAGSDTANLHSENTQKQENNDNEYLLCETCEECHDSSHRVVQIQKDDKMVMNQQQTQQAVPRMSQLEKSIKIIPQTNFQTSQILSQPQTNSNGAFKTGLNNHVAAQERISNCKDNLPLNSSSDYHLQHSIPNQRHDYKSSTVFLNPPVEIITSQFDLMEGTSAKEPKFETVSDNFEDNSQFKPSGRISSNHNFKSQNQLHQIYPGLNSNDTIPNENLNQENKIIQSSEIAIPPSQEPKNQLTITPQDVSPLQNLKVGSLAESQKIEQIQCDTQVLEVINNQNHSKMQVTSQNIVESSQEVQKGAASNTTLICLKSTFYSAASSKLTSSYVFASNRNSLTSSIVNVTQSSQYRAKLLLSFSSDILSDGSIVVFQEISNNGSENWPNDVFLQCISGITETSYYPAIKVNKGEIMHIAFSLDIQNYLKIQKSQLTEGEQVKTSWRLYYQQLNFEKQFFGPKITIQFTYKKPQKSETEDTLESISKTIHDTMKKIFTEDDQIVFQEFLQINKEKISVYFKEKKEDFTISKLIVQCIEQYVLYRIAKSKAASVEEKID